MNLFAALPSELFSILASPNRLLYADALDVLYEAYRGSLKIPEYTLYSMLRSRLEQQLAEANFDGEDIDEEELKDISGRARFLIRKLGSKGWIEKERGEDFEEYISVFRAAGISVTLLLQSESQLESMYGENEATTIINNCDTYVYMGGMDIKTCKNISQRLDKPLKMVLSMPLEQVVVFRRGEEPFVSRRYQILNDPLYQVLMAKKSDEDDNTYR